MRTMTGDGGRGGRRGNGLAAAAYTPLADLDPRLADAALEALRVAGVAAYITPTTGTQGGYLEVTLPDRPTDRVWVDAAARSRAADVLAAEVAGGSASTEQAAALDDEESWKTIVATFRAQPAGARPWPSAEDLEDPAAGPRFLPRPAGPVPSTPEEAVEDEHYVPPAPPPVPQPHPVTRWAVLALAVGLAVLVLPAALGDPVGPGMSLLAVLAVLGGFVTLVARMRDAPPDDSDPDDGAVV